MVYIFRRGAAVEFLQMLREREPMKGTWQPVAGGIEVDEAAPWAALREVREETGLAHGGAPFLGFWKLDGVHPFYLPARDVVMLCPSFAVEAAPGWEPVLNAEHSAARWVAATEIDARFMWPGQVASCREVLERLLRPGSLSEAAQRLDPAAEKRRRQAGLR
jgi:8-oxo-dGTP pyrophosphatase MutT (NUDIX family)